MELVASILGTAGSLLTLAILLYVQTRRAGDEKAGRAELAVRLETSLANTKTESARADFEKRRADALVAEITRMAGAAPIDGAYVQLLALAAAAGTANGASPGVMPDAGAAGEPATAVGPDDLLKPGS